MNCLYSHVPNLQHKTVYLKMRECLNKSQGYIKLMIDDRMLIGKQFRTLKERKELLKAWSNIFEGIETKGMVSISVFHYGFLTFYTGKERLKKLNGVV